MSRDNPLSHCPAPCQLLVPVMMDNHVDDKYFYEIVVETGPMPNHGTTANISFILTGEEDNTGELNARINLVNSKASLNMCSTSSD